MFRHAIIALMLTTGAAYAGCQTPELEFGLEVDQDYRGNTDQKIELKLVFPLGKVAHTLCNKEIALMSAKEITEWNKARKEKADARGKDAKAREQEQDNLEQRIAICSDFTFDAAPNSIKEFCGDLLERK